MESRQDGRARENLEGELGDELALDGSVRFIHNLRLVGRAYRNSTETLESDLFLRSGEGLIGVRFTRGASRIEIRGNHRESQYGTTNLRRTISVLAGTRRGPFSASGNADVGQQDRRVSTGSRSTAATCGG